MSEEMTYRRLVKSEDLNPAGTLFGGRLLEWADEAVAIYASYQLNTRQIVTAHISEVNFKKRVENGAVIEFYTQVAKIGHTSITISCRVQAKYFEEHLKSDLSGETITPHVDNVFSCSFVFVAVDSEGKPTPHGLTET